jgi:hypothetical protein
LSKSVRHIRRICHDEHHYCYHNGNTSNHKFGNILIPYINEIIDRTIY